MSFETLRGKYLVLEGIDGSGKSTQVRNLTSSLVEAGVESVVTFEPGNTKIGELLRAIILDPELPRLPETEFDLLTADRREHAHVNIRPNLLSGKTVVSDRNWFSSVAFQGFGWGLPVEDIIEQSKRAMGDYFIPDGAVILDVPLEVAAARRRSRSADWFEKQRKEFFEKVRQGYHYVAERFDISVLDATPSSEVVALSIIDELGRAVLSHTV